MLTKYIKISGDEFEVKPIISLLKRFIESNSYDFNLKEIKTNTKFTYVVLEHEEDKINSLIKKLTEIKNKTNIALII